MNYDGIPNGVKIADLKREHNCILRNPDVAQICFLRKYVEMLYEAIKRTPGLKVLSFSLASVIGKGVPTTERYIKKLKEANYISFVGAPRIGGYYVNNISS